MSDNSHRPLVLIKCVMGVAFETEHKHFILSKKQNWPYPTAQTKKNVCLLVTSAPIWHGYNSMKMEKDFEQWRKERSWFIQRPHTTWFFIDESNNRHLFLEIVVYTFSVGFFFVSMIAHTVSTFLNMHCHHRKKW